MPRYQCRRWWRGCRYSVSRKDRRRRHEEKCKVEECRSLSIHFFKLLKEHHDLSCDIKWFSLAHEFGRNNNFKYHIVDDDSVFESIYILFEDASHLINFDNPYERLRRIYTFTVFRTEKYHCFIASRRSSGLNESHCTEVSDYLYGLFEAYGSLNDIYKGDIEFEYENCHPQFGLEQYKAMSSIESIENKKNELQIIRKKIDEILFPFFIEYLLRVLIPIIVDYCL